VPCILSSIQVQSSLDYIPRPWGEFNQKRYKLTVTSKDSNSPDTIKDILKSRINPTDIRAGINSLKTLRNGKVQIEARNKVDIEILTKDIHERGDRLEVIVHRLRNPRMVIYNVPEDISTQNVEETILAQNPEFNLNKWEITAKFLCDKECTLGT